MLSVPIASNRSVIILKAGKDVEVVAYFEVVSRIQLEAVSKATKSLKQDSS